MLRALSPGPPQPQPQPNVAYALGSVPGAPQQLPSPLASLFGPAGLSSIGGGGPTDGPGWQSKLGLLAVMSVVGAGVWLLTKGFRSGGFLSNMKKNEVVALMAASLLSGPEYQKKLMACSSAAETEKVAKAAVAVAEMIVNAANEFEADMELQARRDEVDKKVLEAKEKLARLSRQLDEATSGASEAIKKQREGAEKSTQAVIDALQGAAASVVTGAPPAVPAGSQVASLPSPVPPAGSP